MEQSNTELNNNTIRDMIGDRCEEIWRQVKKSYRQVRDIGNKYKLVNEMGNFNIHVLEEDFHASIYKIYQKLTDEWAKNKYMINKYE
jgi:hypothetical protein